MPILLTSELVAVLRGKVATIRGTICPLLLMDGMLVRFKVGRATGRDLA